MSFRPYAAMGVLATAGAIVIVSGVGVSRLAIAGGWLSCRLGRHRLRRLRTFAGERFFCLRWQCQHRRRHFFDERGRVIAG